MKILSHAKKFSCLASESFISFDCYIKKLRFEFASALLSEFLRKVTFAIFERKHEPKGVIRPALYAIICFF